MTLTGNVGKDDRIVRAIIGVGFISMVFVGPETAWGWFGLIPLLTAVVGFCPLYTKLGFNTSDKKEATEESQEQTQNAVAQDAVAQKAEALKTETVQESAEQGAIVPEAIVVQESIAQESIAAEVTETVTATATPKKRKSKKAKVVSPKEPAGAA